MKQFDNKYGVYYKCNQTTWSFMNSKIQLEFSTAPLHWIWTHFTENNWRASI